MNRDMPDPGDVERLSDRDNDFIFKAEPGKGFNRYVKREHATVKANGSH